MIQKARLEDCDQLTQVALTSKAYWGYSAEDLESWREDLAVTPEMLEKWEVKVMYSEDDPTRIIAFYILNLEDPNDECELEFLFVLPECIGKGIGREMLNSAFGSAVANEKRKMIVLSDPNAESFYAKYGFKAVFKKESSIPGRFLPIMEKDLSEVS